MHIKKISALFATAALGLAVATPAAQAYNPNPTTPKEAQAEIDNLVDAVDFMNSGLQKFIKRLAEDKPYSTLKGGEDKSCYTITNGANFGLNYGIGQVNTDMMELEQVEAHEENGTLVPSEAQPDRYFDDAATLLKTYRDTINDPALKDMHLPEGTYLGCTQNPDTLRPALTTINTAIASGYFNRMGIRMRQDYRHFNDILQNAPAAPKSP